MKLRQCFRHLGALRGNLPLAALLVTAALLLPPIPIKRASFDYLFVFDITQSMNVIDAALGAAGQPGPSRLDAVKTALLGALEQLPCGSRAGLALFAGHRTFLLFTPVELCADFAELQAMIAAIDWRMAWAARSEVAKGLFKSAALATRLDARLVFFTDGHEAPPIHPDYRQRYRSTPEQPPLRGLLVGVGGEQPAPIPKYDRDNKLLGYWRHDEVMQVDTYSLGREGRGEQMVGVEAGDLAARIAGGQEHLSSLKQAYLLELAAETGLHYVRLNGAEALAESLTAGYLAGSREQPTDLRWLPAGLALLVLLSGLRRSV